MKFKGYPTNCMRACTISIGRKLIGMGWRNKVQSFLQDKFEKSAGSFHVRLCSLPRLRAGPNRVRAIYQLFLRVNRARIPRKATSFSTIPYHYYLRIRAGNSSKSNHAPTKLFRRERRSAWSTLRRMVSLVILFLATPKQSKRHSPSTMRPRKNCRCFGWRADEDLCRISDYNVLLSKSRNHWEFNQWYCLRV